MQLSSSPSALPLKILGTGVYLPSRSIDSVEFDRRWNKPEGWTFRHAGVRHRRYASAAEPASLMGAQAVQAALAAAGLRATEIDCVVSACSVMEQALPCQAVWIQRRLGLEGSGIPAFDINATCLSFLAALDLVGTALAVRRYERVLIVSSEVASAGLNHDDPDTAPLFGDGAAAVVVGRRDEDDSGQLLAAHMQTWSEGAEFCQVRAAGTRLRAGDDVTAFLAGHRFEMEGRATYRLAAQHLPGFMEQLLKRAGVGLDAVRKIVPHQASAKALKHLQLAMKLPPDSLVQILETHGNQMAASIPTALHYVIAAGEIARGDLIALVGSGAGLSFGGVVLRY